MKQSLTDIVLLARSGDQEAIAELYEQSYNSVYQSVRAIIKDEEDALDIVQDSFIKGFQNLDKLDDPEKYQAWMKKLASNTALDYLRKKKPILFSERLNEEGEEIDLQHTDDCLEHQPEAVMDRNETTRLINGILDTLSTEQRVAIVMHYYEQISVREIAEKLECSENTVKSRLNYGRKKIEIAVKALEKQGTKLYSLAPLPFFLWLLRMAKAGGITVAKTAAVGAAGAGAAAAATAGESAAAGGTAAAGSSAAATTANTVGTAAGKTLATKIVAGTLAASLTVGGGVAIANNVNRQKENEEAHRVYQDILDVLVRASEMGYDAMRYEELEFMEEISEDVLTKYPDDLDNARRVGPVGPTVSPEDRYVRTLRFPKWGSPMYEEGIGVPDYMFPLNYTFAFGQFVLTDSDGFEFGHGIDYGFSDLDNDGIDELLIHFYGQEKPKGHYLHIINYYDGEIHLGYILDFDTHWDIHPFSHYEFLCRVDGQWVEEDCYHIAIEFAHESLFDPDSVRPVHRESWPVPDVEFQHLWGEAGVHRCNFLADMV